MNGNATNINWFPGHMAKTLRQIREQLKMVDMVVETCDARIPASSRNPEFDKIVAQKPRILVLSKSDLADPKITIKWIDYFQSKKIVALACDSTKRKQLEPLRQKIISMNRQKIEQAKARGRLIRPIRVMVAGIPNTGKSTLINSLSGKKTAGVGDKPGLTRKMSWIRSGTEFELMDTPGVLWPRLESNQEKINLAATGAIKDEILPIEELAVQIMKFLLQFYPQDFINRYLSKVGLEQIQGQFSLADLWEQAAREKGCILTGDSIDNLRFAKHLLDDLRAGRIGRISLEEPKRNK